MVRPDESEKRATSMVMVTIGPEDDNCPICQAARAGKTPDEIAAMVEGGLEIPPEVQVILVKPEEGS